MALASLRAFAQGVTPTANVQTAASNLTGSDYVCVQRGPDSRVWQRSVIRTNADGSASTNVESFKELHSGVCHQNEAGQWVDSVEEIDLTATGAEATQGAYQVQWAANINTPTGAVRLTSPNGQVFSSTVYGLSYRDASTGTNVLIAPLQDSIGQIVGQNQAVYTNAFSGVNADIEYIYKVEGMEQNIVLREQPPSPADFNLNPETTFFEVVTKFFNAPVASKSTVISTNVTDDRVIGFKDMLMGQGVAFLIGNQSQGSGSGFGVTKHWAPQEDGLAILFEEVPYSALSNVANALPLHSSNAKPAKEIRRTASLKAPSQKASAGVQNTSSMKITRRDEHEGKKPGFIVDYMLNGYESGPSNFVFQSDTTYFISGVWQFKGAPGTIIFEGGTVVKYTNNATIYNYDSSSIGVFGGSAYQPSVFTSWEDNNVGTTIPGSFGSPSVVPSTTYYIEANNGAAWSNYVSNARFSYADYAYTDYTHPVFTFENCQFVNCISATATEGGTNIFFKNNLCSGCSNVFAGGSKNLPVTVIIDAENITADSCGAFAKTNSWWGPCSYSGGITNSILTACDNSTALFTLDHTIVTNSGSNIYQNAVAGKYYLANGSPYANAGTTSIDPGLLSDLQTLTTHPPVVFSNLAIATNLTLSPSDVRNTGAPDYGYHYAPIDYAFSGLTISNASLSVMPGCVVAAFGSPSASFGLMLDYGGTTIFQGTARSPACFVTCSAVQEEWESNALSVSFVTPMYGITPPSANFQFTIWATLANQTQTDASDMASIGFQNCQLYDGIFYAISPTLHITNSMLRRVTLSLDDSDGYPSSPSGNWMVNNLLINGSLQLNHGNTNVAWIFRDNLFDGTGIPQQLTNDICNHNAPTSQIVKC
ncbi:MAG TPA: hypothetical protein VH595_08460 [Verrucomicrobiae bacterium]|jgi:hypothetical protein|nr:hypothetical protein [Verrucomicrobiae bacterium]